VDCSLIEGELVPFHFGNLAGEERASLEAHLLGCARCLQAYLEVKRAIETGPGLAPRPSSSLRARMRAELAEELGVPPHRSRVRVMGALAASLVAAAGLVGMLATRGGGPATPARMREAPSPSAIAQVPIEQEVDTARPVTAGPQFL
jgi:hypothetical protein